MGRPLSAGSVDLRVDELERQLAKLTKINTALMQRVERSMDQQANAYSLFQTAITLEGQVRVRTEELKSALSRLERTNDELTAARDASERANRFKTRFFTAVGHDLLQPLHAARLSVSALTEPSSTPHQRKLAERIEHALTTIEDLLRSILDISKLEAGVIAPSVRPLALDELLASLALDIEPLARAKNLSLTWRPSRLMVASDPLMLRRIVQNLATNAVQYTRKGGVKLAARRRGSQVRIEVWDTGPGILRAEQDMIFEEFRRGPTSDRAAAGGFGLGLSIVKRMAEALDHPLELCSKVGHGSRFSISVPLSGIVFEPRVPAAQTSARSYGMTGVKAVVIDNDLAVLDAMQSLLESWACEVRLASGLSETNELISESDFLPQIVIADYHLNSGTCGLDAVESLRAAAGEPSLPAIVVTADRSAEIVDSARAARCELLLKPVKPAELRALMLHLLSGAAGVGS
jgi:signal transduction histidine kinase/CheY-like chemotaxis protein